MIKMINVNKTYTDNLNQTFSIADLSLNILSQDTFGIVGKSGAGKSTILKLIANLDTIDSGDIIVNDKDISKLSKKDSYLYAKSYGYIFQDANLLSNLSVIDNVALPLKLNGINKKVRYEQALKMLSYVGLDNYEERYISQLSGGQKQRVAIARALINNPKILFCDEITSSLDYDTSYEIINLIQKIKKDLKITIVFVSHDLNIVKMICNRVAIIQEGKLVNIVTLQKNDSLVKPIDYESYLCGIAL